MRVLIVESQTPLAALWQKHLERKGVSVRHAATQSEALAALEEEAFASIILNVVMDNRGALAVSDMAQFRQPQARVIFITSTNFFSDGSIFNLYPNACAFLHSETSPDDLVAVVEHYAA